MKKGYIEIISNKVYFTYYQLYKPDKRDSKYYHNSVRMYNQLKLEYLKDMKAYEASKKTVEVSNVKSYYDLYKIYTQDGRCMDVIENNQKAEAEVTDKAIITKLS